MLNRGHKLYLDIAIINEKKVKSFSFFNGKLEFEDCNNLNPLVKIQYFDSADEDAPRIQIR